jgi:hypothetical protein
LSDVDVVIPSIFRLNQLILFYLKMRKCVYELINTHILT